MKLIADLHTHTVASGHAYSTVMENARAAADRGLEIIAITDHGPAMPGGPHKYHFSNMRVLPSYIYGVRILRGVEANIDKEGCLDLPERFLANLDIVLGGFHFDTFEPGDVEHNTRAMLAAITSGKVDVIVHPGNPSFPVDIQVVARAALDHRVLLEINNTSLAEGSVRHGSKENCLRLAKEVARLGGRVSLGSDAHYAGQVGGLENAARVAAEAGLKPEQVINTNGDAIFDFLKQRGQRAQINPVPRV